MSVDIDVRDFIAQSNTTFLTQCCDIVYHFSKIKRHYVQCAQVIEHIAESSDEKDHHLRFFGVHVRMHAMRLLELWLCAISELHTSGARIHDCERCVSDSIDADDSIVGASPPMSFADATKIAGVCMMVALKFAIDDTLLNKTNLNPIHKYKIVQKKRPRWRFHSSPHFAYVFLNDYVIKQLYGVDCNDNVQRVTDIGAEALFTTRNMSNVAERVMLKRLKYTLHITTECHFIDLFCDDIKDILRAQRSARTQLSSICSVARNIQTFAYVYMIYASTYALSGYVGGEVPTWMSGFCVTLVAMRDVMGDTPRFRRILASMCRRYAPTTWNRRSVAEHCKQLYGDLHEHMKPVLSVGDNNRSTTIIVSTSAITSRKRATVEEDDTAVHEMIAGPTHMTSSIGAANKRQRR